MCFPQEEEEDVLFNNNCVQNEYDLCNIAIYGGTFLLRVKRFLLEKNITSLHNSNLTHYYNILILKFVKIGHGMYKLK